MAENASSDRGPDAHGLAASLRGVTKTYSNGVMALGPIDLDVRKGEFVSLLGPSGCGKSTALRLIAGLTVATSGAVRVSSSRRGGGKHSRVYLYQDPPFIPGTKAAENVRLPLKLSHA